MSHNISVDLDRTRYTRNGAFIDLSIFRHRNGAHPLNPKLVPDRNGRYNVMLSASTFTARSRNGPGPHLHLDENDYEGATIRLRDTHN